MRKGILVIALMALSGVAHAQNMNEELDECMRNPMSRWCNTMQNEDRQRSFDQNQRFQNDRRAQMCAMGLRQYCY